MWFKKTIDEVEDYPLPGTERAMDAHAAVYAMAAAASDAVVVHAVPETTEMTGPLKTLASQAYGPVSDLPVIIRQVEGLQPLTALVTGYAMAGLRATALVGELTSAHDALYAMAGKRLPCVINMICRAVHRQAGVLHGGHDGYYGVADAGFFQLFARNVQEATDFTMIAHRIAELTLTPGLCACDLYETSHSVQTVRLPDRDLIRLYLGRSGDEIDTPTPAQSVLYGARRRRIPRLMDPDHPAGIGSIQGEESYFRALAASRTFFASHIEEITHRAMQEFRALTGRFYGPLSGYHADDADILVIAQGAVVEALEAVVDHLRSNERVKAGVVNLSLFRPFPGARLTHLLKGKKAVTILERVDQPLAEDQPLAREVRSAIDKAVENGHAGDDTGLYNAYAAYRKSGDRPQVFSGTYGVGGALPTFGDLLAVFRNMLPAGSRKKRFYTGIDFDRSHRRFPHLQTLQQRLHLNYPGLSDLSLPGVENGSPPDASGQWVLLHALSSQGGLFAGNLFAQALADALHRRVRTFPQGGLEPGLQTARMTIAHTGTDRVIAATPDTPDTLLISSYKILDTLPWVGAIREGGTVIVESNRSPEDLWQGLSGRTIREIRTHAVRLYVIDARTIAHETASNPSFIDQLAVWALLGAYLRTSSQISEGDAEQVRTHLRARLDTLLHPAHYLVEDIETVITRGADECVELPWTSWKTPAHPETESAAPWTVRQATLWDGTVFDLTRFWHSVGYFYDNGMSEETLIDPYLATGIVPGRSSAFRDMTPYRTRLPHWLPENCTGCSLCWTYCPDSALPSTIQSASSLIRTGMDACGKNAGMVQMQRIIDPLAKQVDRLIAGDGLHQYTTLGPVMKDAFDQLLERMAPPDHIREALTEEFQHVYDLLASAPVARTEAFFDTPYKRDRRGRLLSIFLNPLSCTGCGICVEVCPEQAFVWTEQTPERLEQCHRHRQFQRMLPEIPDDLLDTLLSTTDPQTLTRRLLADAPYHSVVGGGALTGHGVKIAVHLLTATIESVMRLRFKAHIDKLSRLVERLEDKIQGRVADTLKINDFEQFGQRLSRLSGGDLTGQKLVELIGDETENVGAAQLQRLNDLLNRLREQRRRYLDGAGGTGRARMIMTIDPGNASYGNETYPYNPYPHPWVCHLPGEAPALAEGIFEGLVRSLAEEVKTCRLVELELNDAYVPAEHDALFAAGDGRFFNGDEWALVPPVLVLGHTGVTRWEDISRLLSSPYPIKIALLNTQGLVINDRTVVRQEEDPGILALRRRDVFVLQTTIGNPGHGMQGIIEGLNQPYPALFHIYAPDPSTNGIAPEKVVDQAQLAFRSRAFPLFRFSPKSDPLLTLAENPEPDRTWTPWEMTVTEPSGVVSSFAVPLTVADWAFREARFRDCFRLVSRGDLNDRMKPVPEYLDLDSEHREGMDAYIHVTDAHGRHFLAIISSAMISAVEDRQTLWKELQELAAADAGLHVRGVTPAAQPRTEPGTMPNAEYDRVAYQRLTERLLRLCGYGRDTDFFNRSLRQFLSEDRRDA